MTALDQFLGDTTGEKRFSRPHCTIKEEIMVVGIEIFDKVSAGPHRILKTGQVLALIILIGQSIEILCAEHFAYVGLFIEQGDHGLLKTVTFLAADIARILTVRAFIDRFQVIRGKAGILQKLCFAAR